MNSRYLRVLLFAATFAFAGLFSGAAAFADYLLVSDRATHSVYRYDYATGEYIAPLNNIAPFVFNPDFDMFVPNIQATPNPSAMVLGSGTDLYVASQYGWVNRYNGVTGEYLNTVTFNVGIPSGLAYDHSRDRLIVSALTPPFDPEDPEPLDGFIGDTLYYYDGVSGGMPTSSGSITFGEPTGRAGAAIGPDGNLYVLEFALGGPTATVFRFDLDNLEAGAVAWANVQTSGASSMLFSPTGEAGAFTLDIVGMNFMQPGTVARLELQMDDENNLAVVGAANPEFISELFWPTSILQAYNDGQILVGNAGNDNPGTGALLSGYIQLYDRETGELIGGFILNSPFSNPDDPDAPLFIPTAMVYQPIPEPSAAWGLAALLGLCIRRRKGGGKG